MSQNENVVTTVCLVRHGESVWNAERRIQGQLDPELSSLGLEQARLVAERLAHQPWTQLYASDLSRARQTAEEIGRKTGLAVRIEWDLREQGQGKREGLPIDEARRLYPDPNAPEVGRETVEALRERAVGIINKIRDAHPGERIVIVSHNGLIQSFLHSIDFPVKGMFNTACTLLHWDGHQWTCDHLVDASHLEGLEQHA